MHSTRPATTNSQIYYYEDRKNGFILCSKSVYSCTLLRSLWRIEEIFYFDHRIKLNDEIKNNKNAKFLWTHGNIWYFYDLIQGCWQCLFAHKIYNFGTWIFACTDEQNIDLNFLFSLRFRQFWISYFFFIRMIALLLTA